MRQVDVKTFCKFEPQIGNGRNTVSRVLFRRKELTEPHWVLRQTRWVLRKTRWVRFGTQIIGWEELTEFAPRNSVSAKKLTEFGVWNRTPRNRIRPVSEQIWLEIITSRDAKSAFKGSRTSCREIIFGIFWPNFGRKRSHHVTDASCRNWPLSSAPATPQP